jgi:hypothetical protein
VCTDKPGQPAPPIIATMTNTTASLTWSPPASDGGAEITNYVLEYRVEGGRKWLVANADTQSTALNFTVTRLTEGTVYEFRVAAQNKAGVGPPSEPTAPTAIKEKLGKTWSVRKFMGDLCDLKTCLLQVAPPVKEKLIQHTGFIVRFANCCLREM